MAHFITFPSGLAIQGIKRLSINFFSSEEMFRESPGGSALMPVRIMIVVLVDDKYEDEIGALAVVKSVIDQTSMCRPDSIIKIALSVIKIAQAQAETYVICWHWLVLASRSLNIVVRF